MNDIVSDLVEELAALALSAQVNPNFKTKAEQPLRVLGDEEQLYRLVSNLMINAIQYTPIGGAITVIIDCSDHQAVIQVHDTGIGIHPNEQKKIFDRFYRVSSDRSRKTGGSGLGLAIAKAIIYSHHGSLQVQSEISKGSTFTVRLPLV